MAPSFESRLRSDAIVGHLNSIVVLNHLNAVVNYVLQEYLEWPEYDGGQTSDDNLHLDQPADDTHQDNPS